MPDITVSYATIGGARLAIVNNGDKDNNSSTLFVSYVDTSRFVSVETDYNLVVTLGGLPLSVSLYTNAGSNPSTDQNIMFYALDVIDNTEFEDEENIGNIPTNPSDKTFTWNGNRLSASRKSDRYCINVVNSGNVGEVSNLFTLMGVPMGQGGQNELIMNKTSHSFSDIKEYKDILIGGSPLTAGRIGNNYYLVVSSEDIS